MRLLKGSHTSLCSFGTQCQWPFGPSSSGGSCLRISLISCVSSLIWADLPLLPPLSGFVGLRTCDHLQHDGLVCEESSSDSVPRKVCPAQQQYASNNNMPKLKQQYAKAQTTVCQSSNNNIPKLKQQYASNNNIPKLKQQYAKVPGAALDARALCIQMVSNNNMPKLK